VFPLLGYEANQNIIVKILNNLYIQIIFFKIKLNMFINNLPDKIAVFPLSNAVFFPKTILPLNIFEKRYIQLVDDCMKDQRLFGMIQPKSKPSKKNEVYEVGCLGKVTSFNETQDKRYLISLTGIIRFRIDKELETKKLYREFKVDYSDFSNDLMDKVFNEQNSQVKNMLNKIKIYFEKKNYMVQFDELKKLNCDQLISTISMISSFSPEEKQKIIETIKIEDKIQVFEKILSFNILDKSKNKTIQ
tara:strand:+ start:465 stop:1202 length:738 start_codon:yes stop_codon:yes gene_type:complete